ncbi:MAG: isocitrate lyase/phosphoenolpyruvate mutase family protein [Chitinophagaceae bacterium]|nr:isocitrate lyase/phosphoenolpyruvate mutase family protein [Chitinophagaceae bacterium]
MENKSQLKKAKRFHELHQNFLVLPNIWDPFGAILLEHMGFPAVATASASVALANGYRDGENIPFHLLLAVVKRIVQSTSLPVTVDMESGYSDTLDQLAQNVSRFLDSGVIGINLEDYCHRSKQLYAADEQCRRIEQIRETADKKGIPLFINARTDVCVKHLSSSKEENFKEAIQRGKKYLEAGADGIFLLGGFEENELVEAVSTLKAPINLLVNTKILDTQRLKQIGIRRVSLGPALFKIMVASIQDILKEVQSENLNAIKNAKITLDELNQLVKV